MIKFTTFAFRLSIIICCLKMFYTVPQDSILQNLGIHDSESKLTLPASQATSTICELVSCHAASDEGDEFKKMLYCALYEAIESDDIETVKALLDAGVHNYTFDDQDDVRSHHLLYAALIAEISSQKKDFPLSRMLMAHGVNIDDFDGNSMTPLMTAIMNEDDEIIDVCLHLEANVNKENPAGETPLIIAAQLSNFDTMKKLIEHGADPNKKDLKGMTALMYVADTNMEDIEVPAKPAEDLTDGELYELYIRRGAHQIIHDLVTAQADIHAHNNKGETALIFACKRSNGGIVDILIRNNVNPFQCDNTNKSAIDYANETDNEFFIHQVNALIGEAITALSQKIRSSLIGFIQASGAHQYSGGQLHALSSDIFQMLQNPKDKALIVAHDERIIDSIIGTQAPHDIPALKWISTCIDMLQQLEIIANRNSIELFDPIYVYLAPRTEYFDTSAEQEFCCDVLAQENPERFNAIGSRWIRYLVHNMTTFDDEAPHITQHDFFRRIIESINERDRAAFIRHRGAGQLLLAEISHENLPLIDILVANGADINARGTHQQTALMQAILKNNFLCMHKLLALGADTTLTDDADRTIFDFALLSNNIQIILHLADRYPELANRRSTPQQLTPFIRHLLNHQTIPMNADVESALIYIGLQLIHRGFNPAIETLYGENTADVAHRMNLDELCTRISSIMYASAPASDRYLDPQEGLDFLKSQTKNRDVAFMAKLSQLKKRLYKYEHTRVKQSVLYAELKKIETAPEEMPEAIDDECIVDSNQAGSFMTYGSYNDLCMNGILHTIPQHAAAAGSMQPARPTLAAYLLRLVEKKGRHELALDDYPVVDPVSLEGFLISHTAFRELLDATKECPMKAQLYGCVRSKAHLASLLEKTPMAAHQAPEALELFDQQKVNLEVVRKIVETHKKTSSDEPPQKRSKYARPPKKS